MANFNQIRFGLISLCLFFTFNPLPTSAFILNGVKYCTLTIRQDQDETIDIIVPQTSVLFLTQKLDVVHSDCSSDSPTSNLF